VFGDTDNRAEFGFAGWRANAWSVVRWHWENCPVGIEAIEVLLLRGVGVDSFSGGQR